MFYMFGSSSKKKVITILSVFLLMQNVMTGVAQPNNQQAGNRREKPGHHKLAKDLDDSIDKQEGKLSSLRTQAPITTGVRGYARYRPCCPTRGRGVWVPAQGRDDGC